MKKISSQIMFAIVTCSMVTSLAIGGITLIRSISYIQEETGRKLSFMSRSYAESFSQRFIGAETSVNVLHSFIRSTFNPQEFLRDDSYLKDYETALDRVLQDVAFKKLGIHGIYFTFNPDLTGKFHEVWYLDLIGNGNYRRVDNELYSQYRETPLTGDDAYPSINAFYPDNEGMGYYYMALDERDGVWYEPLEEPGLPIKTLGFSKAVFVGDVLTGVVGIDINIEDIKQYIAEMKVMEHGFAFLINEELKVISHPYIDEGIRLTDTDNEIYHLLGGLTEKDKYGIIEGSSNGKRAIYAYSYLPNGWILVLYPPLDEIFQPVKDLSLIIVLITLTVIVLSILAAYFFSSRISIPVETAIEQLRHIIDDEVEKNRQKDAVIIYQSRLAKMGEMVANIAHQWRQPLNNLSLILSNIKDASQYGDLNKKKLDQSLLRSNRIIQKMSQTIDDFRFFLKPKEQKEYFSLHKTINFAIELMENSIKLNKIDVHVNLKKDSKVFGYSNEFSQVISNILNNAKDALIESAPKDRKIIITLDKNNSEILIDIFNNGSNILEETQKNLFKPYFTTKTDGKGTGIGLYMSKLIIEKHLNGRISLKNTRDGVVCRIILPSDSQEKS